MSQNIPRNDLVASVACEILVSFLGAVLTCCSAMPSGPRGCGLSHRLGVGNPCSPSILHSRKPGATAGAVTKRCGHSVLAPSHSGSFSCCLGWTAWRMSLISRWWRCMWSRSGSWSLAQDLIWTFGALPGCLGLGWSTCILVQVQTLNYLGQFVFQQSIWVSEEPLISFSYKVNAKWKILIPRQTK